MNEEPIATTQHSRPKSRTCSVPKLLRGGSNGFGRGSRCSSHVLGELCLSVTLLGALCLAFLSLCLAFAFAFAFALSTLRGLRLLRMRLLLLRLRERAFAERRRKLRSGGGEGRRTINPVEQAKNGHKRKRETKRAMYC